MRILATATIVAALTLPALAQTIPYKRNVTLKVGESVVLKGVRSADCSKTQAQSWDHVASGLPRSKLGTFSNGGTGKVNSNSCGGRVAARGVRFTARKTGSERLVVFDDAISITVR